MEGLAVRHQTPARQTLHYQLRPFLPVLSFFSLYLWGSGSFFSQNLIFLSRLDLLFQNFSRENDIGEILEQIHLLQPSSPCVHYLTDYKKRGDGEERIGTAGSIRVIEAEEDLLRPRGLSEEETEEEGEGDDREEAEGDRSGMSDTSASAFVRGEKGDITGGVAFFETTIGEEDFFKLFAEFCIESDATRGDEEGEEDEETEVVM